MCRPSAEGTLSGPRDPRCPLAEWGHDPAARPLVRIEGVSKRDGSELMGRTYCNRVVNFPGNARLIGQMVDVKITEAKAYTLRGEVLLKD